MGHTLAQFAFNAPAFLLPHLIEPRQCLVNFGHNGSLEYSIGRVIGGIEGTGHAQYGVEIGVCREAEFSRGRSESGDVASHPVAVPTQAFATTPPTPYRNFN